MTGLTGLECPQKGHTRAVVTHMATARVIYLNSYVRTACLRCFNFFSIVKLFALKFLMVKTVCRLYLFRDSRNSHKNLGNFIPCPVIHNSGDGKAEHGLELFHGSSGILPEDSVGNQGGDGGIYGGDGV